VTTDGHRLGMLSAEIQQAFDNEFSVRKLGDSPVYGRREMKPNGSMITEIREKCGPVGSSNSFCLNKFIIQS
jgi:hypothetical protein